MTVAKLDQYLLGPRFYKLEFERSIAMRKLALRQYPLDSGSVGKDIVHAVENVVRATLDYSEELAIEARKVSANLKCVDTMSSSFRIDQLCNLIGELEHAVQSLIRYGWRIEREWHTYVRAHAHGPERTRKSSRTGVFPANYLRSLGTWHTVLINALKRIRCRSHEVKYGQPHAVDSGLPWKSIGMFFTANPMHWNSAYVLEKVKAERSKPKVLDPWLDSVPNVIQIRPGQNWYMQSVDIRGRNPFHYAAQSPSDLVWLRRFQYLYKQDIQHYAEPPRMAPLAACDIFGYTPLAIAAKCGNLGAVKYIVDEAGVDSVCDGLVDAAVVAFAHGHHECLPPIINKLIAFPEKVAMLVRLSMFYGFGPLFGIAFRSCKDAGGSVYSKSLLAMEAGASRPGECTMLHLAALNGNADMLKLGLCQDVPESAAFSPHERDDAGLTALDVANYFGYRECAEVLVGTFPSGIPPVHEALGACDAALQVPPFEPRWNGRSSPPEETYSIFITIGTNDSRRLADYPPIALNTDSINKLLKECDLPPSTHLLLRIDSGQGVEINNEHGWTVDVSSLIYDPAMSTGAWQPPAHFYAVYPEKLVLQLDLIAIVNHALLPPGGEHKVVAHAAVTLPTSFIPSSNEIGAGKYAPLCSSTGNYLCASFISSTSGTVVGETNLEVVVAAPYNSPNISPAVASPSSDTTLSSPFGSNPLDEHVSSDTERRRRRRHNSRRHRCGSCHHSRETYSRTAATFSDNINNICSNSSHNNGWDFGCRYRQWNMEPCTIPGQTLVYGHRGSGMNASPADRSYRLQLKENTASSMAQAVKDGAWAVEFDVQLTRDMVPVIYHDWNVAETGLDVPVNALTLKHFQSLHPHHGRLTTSRSCSKLRAAAGNILSGSTSERVADSVKAVHAPFATLRELFETLPESVGFDIEIKYPMADEASEAGICTSFEMNIFIDKILDVVLSYIGPRQLAHASLASSPASQPTSRRCRPIVFTSFHPDVCLLLAHKVNDLFPIMLLTDAGMSKMADRRCNSLDAAVKLCKWAGLTGVVSHVGPVAESPRVAFLVRQHGLVLATYGKQNNQARYVRMQSAYGVDVVIVDEVRTACSALDTDTLLAN